MAQGRNRRSRLPPEARGDFLGVTRTFFKRETAGKEVVLWPLKDGEALAVGDEALCSLELRTRRLDLGAR